MENHNNFSCADCYAQGFEELYAIKTLVNVTKNTCKNIEFKGVYYGLEKQKIACLSAERNDYIYLLELISDKISDFMNIYISLEDELSYNNTPTIAAER